MSRHFHSFTSSLHCSDSCRVCYSNFLVDYGKSTGKPLSSSMLPLPVWLYCFANLHFGQRDFKRQQMCVFVYAVFNRVWYVANLAILHVLWLMWCCVGPSLFVDLNVRYGCIRPEFMAESCVFLCVLRVTSLLFSPCFGVTFLYCFCWHWSSVLYWSHESELFMAAAADIHPSLSERTLQGQHYTSKWSSTKSNYITAKREKWMYFNQL